MTITTIGIDLAKNVFAVHGVDQNGKTVLVKSKVTHAALPGGIASQQRQFFAHTAGFAVSLDGAAIRTIRCCALRSTPDNRYESPRQ